MSDLLIQSLKAQARLHHKSSAHGLGKLFDCAVDEIESLREHLKTAKADGIREAIKVAQSCLMHSEAYKNKNHLNIGDFIVELINYANKLRGK